MDVVTIGGGPGGLYASLLVKRSNPSWDVTVYEQNPRGVTYGWGIVLPNRTLSKLEAADQPSHEAIREAATQWDPFDLYYDGERYRSEGHAFMSLQRTELLALLQERCEELGVELVFDHAIGDPRDVAADADLVLGADGINSATRRAYADEFGAETIEGSTRFSWFGTDADFDALSHIFVENEDGIWCAHTYPGTTSTFIVDCDAETWANVRLDQRPEDEYLAYLEDVFADYLDGHGLLSQQDKWRTFTTVRNDTWRHENVVLLGDAAHTAHYSIGSGTTIALEDAISLAGAFDDHDDVGSALAAYESERRPSSESLQRAAEQSRLHFEHIRRFYELEGVQFALHHLTRSGRLSYESMRRRDPDLVAAFEDWFAATTPGGPDDPDAVRDPSPPAAHSLALRDVELPGRTVRASEPTVSAHEGTPATHELAGFRARAAGHAGLTLTQPLAVSQAGRPTPGSPGLYRDEHANKWADVVDDDGSPVGAHLVHAGGRGGSQPRAFTLDRPSPRNEAWAPRMTDQYPTRPGAFVPSEMDADLREQVEADFVAAAERAADVGFDYLQLHLAGGYLLGSFLSPVTNDRTDEYGGDIDDRLRYPLAVVEAVRDVWPADRPLGVTLQATDWVEGGLTIDDAVTVGRALVDAGVDVIAPVAGGVVPDETPDEIEGLANYSDHLRNELDVPTMATVHATTRDEVDTLVATGRADLCTYYGPPLTPE